MDDGGKQIYRFGDIQIDARLYTITRHGSERHLRQRSLEVLLYLLQNRDRVVSKEELIQNIWRVTAVTDDALVQCIVEIRKALGDDPRRPHVIKTIPKSGYRFIASVEEIEPNHSALVMEEVTSIEMEIEENIPELMQPDQSSIVAFAQRKLEGAAGYGKRTRFLVASVLMVSVITTLLVYMALAKQQIAEPVLPQIPGKKSIVVLFFDNQSGDRELNWLREGLADMLITALSHSSQLNLLSRHQLFLLLEKTGHKEKEKIRLDEALKIGKKSQAEVVVLGSFARLGDHIRIQTALHDARTGRLIAADSLTVERPAELLRQIDLLALKLSSRLGITTPVENVNPKLTKMMTTNLDAYRYYSLGVEKAQALQNQEAIALLKKAISIDPQFAMAYGRIGYTYAVQWNFSDEAKPHLQKAFQLSDKLTEKDKLYITSWYAIANADFLTAIRSFQQLIKRYPFEVEAYLQLGRLLVGEGRYQEAIDTFRHGLVIDAEDKDLCNALGGLYSTLYRHSDAIALHQRYVALAATEPNAHDSLGLTYQAAGRYPEALEEFNRALSLDPEFEVAIVHSGNTYFQMGRYQDAIRSFQRYIDIAGSDDERARGYDSVSYVYWKKGDAKRAEEAAAESSKFREGSGGNIRAMLAFERGDKAEAQTLKNALLDTWPRVARGGRFELRYFRSVTGMLALKEGRTQQAIEMFKQALQARAIIWHLDSFEDCLANAYLELGRVDEAIAEYERILRLNPNYPLAQFHLAEAYDAKGKTDRALQKYEEFLRIWKEADSDIPEVKVARERLRLYQATRL